MTTPTTSATSRRGTAGRWSPSATPRTHQRPPPARAPRWRWRTGWFWPRCCATRRTCPPPSRPTRGCAAPGWRGSSPRVRAAAAPRLRDRWRDRCATQPFDWSSATPSPRRSSPGCTTTASTGSRPWCRSPLGPRSEACGSGGPQVRTDGLKHGICRSRVGGADRATSATTASPWWRASSTGSSVRWNARPRRWSSTRQACGTEARAEDGHVERPRGAGTGSGLGTGLGREG